MAKIASIHIREIRKPLKTTFATALGSKAFLHNFLVTVRLDDGCEGLGEIPTSFSRPDETPARIREIMAQLRSELKYAELDGYEKRLKDFRSRFPRERMTISGLEVALFRALLKGRAVSEHRFFGARSGRLATDITIPFVPDVQSLTKWIGYALRRQFTLFKVKVSGRIEEDKSFLSLVYDILARAGTPFRLRLDGNQGFAAEAFLRLADWIRSKGYPVELFEQPLSKHDLKGHRRIRKAALLPIILDESVESAQDMARVLEAEACDGVNIKIAKSGIAESLEIAALARANGLSLMIGCMTETMVGLSAAIHLAAGIDSFQYVDLDSVYLLHHKNTYDDILLTGPIFSIR
jgi:L-Ala-D/L-Glu epimerase